MAKRQKVKRFSVKAWDNSHYRQTDEYTRAVDVLFDRATAEISKAASRGKYDPDKPFSFEDYPSVQSVMQKVITGLANKVTTVIESGSKKQWLFACAKNDGFIDSIMDTSKISKARLKKMQDRNLDALHDFQARKIEGMNLSQRVWKYTKQYKDQIEVALDVGLGEGRSAQQLARDVKQNLKEPNRLFRRVRDKRGQLHLSKAAMAYHPGRGVYRSSVKNAQRLTRTEINMAYRESDYLRWQQLDFVVGFEVKRSNHEPLCKCDVCAKLVGRYPKPFKFKGWHPQCMCYAVPILMDEDEFDNNELGDLKAALRGTTYKKQSSRNAVPDVPKGFQDWVDAHKEAQKNWSSTPYFIRDNFVDGDLEKGLKPLFPIQHTPKPEPKVDPVQLELDALAPQIQAIKARATEYGTQTMALDNYVTKKDVANVKRQLTSLKSSFDELDARFKAFTDDLDLTIQEARKSNVPVDGVLSGTITKRDWYGKDVIFENAVAKLKKAIEDADTTSDKPHKAVKQSYTTNEEVNETFRVINSEFDSEPWFEHGDLNLQVERNPWNNGSTNMRGKIMLTSSRLEYVRSALGKIGQKKSADITFQEADAMATFWHEITHNRNKPGNIGITTNQTRAMELANEFVARHSLAEFYGKLGVKVLPHPEFQTTRGSTGYNRRVCNYQHVIKVLNLDEAVVLKKVREHLFNDWYYDQQKGLEDALIAGGLKKANGKKATKIATLMKMIRDDYSEETIDKWLKDNGYL